MTDRPTRPAEDAGGRLVLIGGPDCACNGRLAVAMESLGLRLPRPETSEQEPRLDDCHEPQWSVDFHSRLAHDPAATADVATLATLRAWLRVQLVGTATVVVNDRHLPSFLPLWLRAAEDVGLRVAYVLPVPDPPTARSEAALWLDALLDAEHTTRDVSRAVARDVDLRADPDGLRRLGEILDLAAIREGVPPTEALRDGPAEPMQHLPGDVGELVREVWEQFGAMSRPGGDETVSRGALDQLRQRWHELCAEDRSLAPTSTTTKRGPAAPAGQAAKARPRPDRARARKKAVQVALPAVRLGRNAKSQVTRRVPVMWRLRAREAVGNLRTLTRRNPKQGGW